jgi:glycerol-3-phosphate acyltransferase PlsY
VLFALVWCIVAAVSRYSSLSALIATVAVVAYFWLVAPVSIGALAATLMAGLVFYKHRENIARLRQGAESRIGARG